jgi:hypothetical protein
LLATSYSPTLKAELSRADLFADYIRWIAAFLDRRGIPREHLRELLAVLDEALAALPAMDRPAVAEVLVAGRGALAAEE